jgi:hypothetical protein
MSLARTGPTLEEEQKARAEIVSHEQSIADLQSQIEGLCLQIGRIEAEKQKHHAAISKCRSVFTLANRIPIELLARIFEIAVLDGYWTVGPLVVSHVCSSWREAAKLPLVWSHVYIDCDKGNPVARCDLWFQMAREAPLDITFRTSMQYSVTAAAFQAVHSRVKRWKRLVLDAHTLQEANLVLAQVTAPGPLLHEVIVDVGESSAPLQVLDSDQASDQFFALQTAFRNAPNLRRLTLTVDQTRTWVGLGQITYLNLQLSKCVFDIHRPLFASEMMDALEAASNLQELVMKVPCDDERPLADSADGPVRIVMLSRLKSLTLEMPTTIMAFIRHVEAPKLQCLNLRCPSTYQTFAGDEVRSSLRWFVEHSSSLRSLELYDVEVAQEDYLFLFAQATALESLSLHGSDILDETIQQLGTFAGDLPRLRRLDLRWCGHVSGDAVAQISENRRTKQGSPLCPLDEITLINCSGVNERQILDISRHSRCRLRIGGPEDYCCK